MSDVINPAVNKKAIIGFGEHVKPINYSHYKAAKLVSEIALALLLSGFILSGLSLTGIAIVPIVGFSISGMAVAALTSSSLLAALSSVVYYKYCKNALFGILNKIIEKIDMPTELGKFGACDTLVCEDTMESFAWKKKLIESAEHNIVLSGNYCGGRSFDEILELINKRMEVNSKLKVVIISSDNFISESNKKNIEQLEAQFGDRFQLVESPDIYHINPGLKKSTNHTKVLAVDYGKYFMLGGSGLEDKYAYAKGLGDRGAKEKDAPDQGGSLMNWFLPRGFRDQDFVFHSGETNGIGKRVYLESIKLALRWEGLSKLKAFNTDVDLAHDFEQCKSVAKNLLLDEAKGKEHPKVKTNITEFHKKCNRGCQTKIYCTGPEHVNNPFERELVKRIQHSKKRIIVDHMYFHPSPKVMQALIEAANRGVKIKIITNGYNEKASPRGHQFFAPRNRCNYAYLKNNVNPEARKNIQVFEFKVRKTTLHKKVVICDDYVISGSSNLGYKSLVTMSDHEMNFVTKSKKLADQSAKIALEVDAKVDYQVDGKEVKGFARKVNNFTLDFSMISSGS